MCYELRSACGYLYFQGLSVDECYQAAREQFFDYRLRDDLVIWVVYPSSIRKVAAYVFRCGDNGFGMTTREGL